MRASNALISSSLPPNLVAVFLGGTSGIAESTLKAFISHTVSPKVYLVGRSQTAADRIIGESRVLGPEGHAGKAEIVFLQADLSSMKVVERVCEDIKAREDTVNLLFLTTGTPSFDRSLTPEGLHKFLATAYYDRVLVTRQLTPLLINGANSGFVRVVSVACGGDEGTLYPEDMPALEIPFTAIRGHLSTLLTLTLEASAATMEGSKISFIHGNPGLVRTPYQDRIQGVFGVYARLLLWAKKITGTAIPLGESGERHLFFLTSARYAPGGVPTEGDFIAIGTDGLKGSGVYSLDKEGESAGENVISTLAKYRKERMIDKVWAHVQGEYERILGTAGT